ncbi:glycosyltransferase family 2 protein [Rhizobium leucaenae]|uniref:Glycosyltransferase involved in cell wall biosynthesis n=1 Tax=Rhizobium leucaenae TaxID=29450 RepID=A0A7W7A0G1_9HYPH|nr:glycosyltransferase family 2 protein [Rhizobium leucaenae]MBB4571677.1 glycosyltransferase involved in cell wall biosynthesis [Rhizobium leucaenae]
MAKANNDSRSTDERWTRLLRSLRPGIGQLGTYPPRALSWPPRKSKNSAAGVLYPKISIVVPSYNQGDYLGHTLKSIISQDYANLELIVVDGGSTDATLQVIKQYESYLAWWVSERDAGQAAAINKGFQRSSGEIMAWVNSDDMVAPGALRRVAEHFMANPRTQAVYGDRIVIDEAGYEIGRWVLPYHSAKLLKWVDFIPQETLYWSRSAWDLVGGRIDERFSFAMDWDFLLRLSNKDIVIQHLPIFLGFFRVHGFQKTSSQMSSVGAKEISAIRVRELGITPSQWKVLLRSVPFLFAAKWCEFFRFKLN